jgi:tRNA threonylcarbamoyladenosine biosynthesis protein TsaE|tara:strand:+ start:39 stop:488 length:450 start_codon:yes stop_codon:yes gene_type:complete
MIIKSLDQLNSFSQKVADHLTKKDYIFLSGDIGVGKTTFTRYLINYLQKKEGSKATEVLSPTFNLLYEYDLKKCKIMHYDLYRIQNVKELNNLGIFQENENAIKIIEWPGIIEISTSDKLEIHLNYAKYKNERKIRLTGTGKWKNFNEL